MTAPESPKNLKDRLSEHFKNFKNNEKIDGLFHYTNQNTRHMINYVLLLIGLILLFTLPLWGGLLIGVVAGLHFYEGITFFIKNVSEIIANQGMVSSLIIGGVLLALFIQAPAIFIGTALAVTIRLFIVH